MLAFIKYILSSIKFLKYQIRIARDVLDKKVSVEQGANLIASYQYQLYRNSGMTRNFSVDIARELARKNLSSKFLTRNPS